jgi:hypothetical protein
MHIREQECYNARMRVFSLYTTRHGMALFQRAYKTETSTLLHVCARIFSSKMCVDFHRRKKIGGISQIFVCATSDYLISSPHAHTFIGTIPDKIPETT